MSVTVTEKELPKVLTPEQAVEAAYSQELADTASKLVRGLPVLIECDKELAPYLFMNLRNRLREAKLQCIYLDGRQRDPQQGAMPMGLIGTMIAQLRDAVRGAIERRVVVLPHLDLLTTSQGGLTGEAREVIPLSTRTRTRVARVQDPSFPLPKVIENLFPCWTSILGTSRIGCAPHHAGGEPEVRPRLLAVATLQVRLGRERGPAPPAPLHPRRRGLPVRPEACLLAGPAGHAQRADGDSEHRSR